MIFEFAACYQLFTALNFGYSGFSKFREDVNKGIKKLVENSANSIEEREREILSKITMLSSEEYHEDVRKKLGEIGTNYNGLIESISSDIDERKNFYEGFRPLFITSAFSCLVLLIMSGLDQSASFDITFFLPDSVILMLLINLLVFSFLVAPSKDKKRGFRILFSLLTMLFIISFITLNITFFRKDTTCVILTLIIVILPYSTLVLRGAYFRIKHGLMIAYAKHRAIFHLKLVALANRIIIK